VRATNGAIVILGAYAKATTSEMDAFCSWFHA